VRGSVLAVVGAGCSLEVGRRVAGRRLRVGYSPMMLVVECEVMGRRTAPRGARRSSDLRLKVVNFKPKRRFPVSGSSSASLDGARPYDRLARRHRGLKPNFPVGRTSTRLFVSASIHPPSTRRHGKTSACGPSASVDRVVQQVVLQILEPIFEPTFHPSSHGFRPHRGAVAFGLSHERGAKLRFPGIRFRPENRRTCSWTHDRDAASSTRHPGPDGSEAAMHPWRTGSRGLEQGLGSNYKLLDTLLHQAQRRLRFRGAVGKKDFDLPLQSGCWLASC
jgi:hypothetical protein